MPLLAGRRHFYDVNNGVDLTSSSYLHVACEAAPQLPCHHKAEEHSLKCSEGPIRFVRRALEATLPETVVDIMWDTAVDVGGRDDGPGIPQHMTCPPANALWLNLEPTASLWAQLIDYIHLLDTPFEEDEAPEPWFIDNIVAIRRSCLAEHPASDKFA